MSLRIASNVGSLVAQHSLNRSSTSMSHSLERLSTGFKVNRGADGPAALVISEKQRAQISGLEHAIENTEKAVSVVQTAEGAFNEINSLLIKVRGLALDSANSGVNDADALAANQKEIDNALASIDRITSSTQFSQRNLLNGDSGTTATATSVNLSSTTGTVDTQSGTYNVEVTAGTKASVDANAVFATLTADETVTVTGDAGTVDITLASGSDADAVAARINDFTSETGVVAVNDGGTLRFDSVDFAGSVAVTTAGDVGTGITTGVSDTGDNVQVELFDIGANSLGVTTGTGNTVTIESGDAKGLSLTVGTDGTDPLSTVSGAQENCVVVDNNALVFQVGANQYQTASLSIDRVDSTSLGRDASTSFGSLNEINVETADGAQESLAVIDKAIDQITNERGELGAFQQNTLESTANNLRTSLENAVNAESVIRDTDFASEIAEFTKQQVLVQAGTSLLGTANQTSQLVLSLL